MHKLKATRSFSKSLIAPIGFVVVLWLLHILTLVFDFHIQQFGIAAQDVSGLAGILLAPLIHGDWQHLGSNTPALLLLGIALFYGYPRSAKSAVVGIWLISGILTWLFARQGVIHYGASGLTHGLMFFLFTIGLIRRDRLAIALALIAFFLYGGMIWSIFPGKPGISFEMHLFGGLAGVFMAFVLKNCDFVVLAKKYDWDNESSDDEDLIGDEWQQNGLNE